MFDLGAIGKDALMFEEFFTATEELKDGYIGKPLVRTFIVMILVLRYSLWIVILVNLFL